MNRAFYLITVLSDLFNVVEIYSRYVFILPWGYFNICKSVATVLVTLLQELQNERRVRKRGRKRENSRRKMAMLLQKVIVHLNKHRHKNMAAVKQIVSNCIY
jgi:hypothetical protein